MRISKVKKRLKEQKLDAILFTDLINIRYLCGYSGSSGLLLVIDTEDAALFFTDFRYKTQAALEVKDAEIIVPDNGSLIDALTKRSELNNIKRIGFEKSITWAQLDGLKTKMPSHLEWLPIDDSVQTMRASKDSKEIANIKVAIKVAQEALKKTLPSLKPGIIERELAAKLDYQLRLIGAEKPAFDTIVVSGERSALVHGKPSDKAIEKGDFVTIDYGAVVNGYASDITRTFIMGKPSKKQREIYETVYRAQAVAIEAAKPGMNGKELDAVARDIIKKAGYGDYFGHGLGHGLGFAVHDRPRVGALSEDVIPKNAMITIEPGIYIPDFGGVRIEDDVRITKNGCEVLTSLPKRLEEMIIE